MIVYWDVEERDKLIKECVEVLNKTRQTHLEYEYTEFVEGKGSCFIIHLRFTGLKWIGQATSVPLPLVDLVKDIGLIGYNEIFLEDETRTNPEIKLKLCKFIISRIWIILKKVWDF